MSHFLGESLHVFEIVFFLPTLGEEGFEELLEFVSQHDLYKEAIKLYKHTTEEFKVKSIS